MGTKILLSTLCSIVVFSILFVQATTLSDLFLLPSGRHVSISAVRKHHSIVRLQDLTHILFELKENESVCSHHVCLDMRELANEDSIIVHKDKFDGDLRRLDQQQPARSTKIRSGNGYTFAIDPMSNSLITAWGPALHLHPLDILRYPGVFVNAAVIGSPALKHNNGTVIDRTNLALFHASRKSQEAHGESEHPDFQALEIVPLLSTSRQQTCTKEHTLELAIEYDESFCALYSDDHVTVLRSLDALEYQLSRLFFNTACVHISFLKSNGICKNQTAFIVQPPKTPPTNQAQCSMHGSCQFSQTMLRFISTYSIDRFYFEPDGTFLFTGYDDGSLLGGAAYRASACNMELSSVWIVRNHAIVVAHEIGHMLGAGHDSNGIMKEIVNPNELLQFTDHSQAEMRKFVNLDSRSWCLRRQSVFAGSYVESRSNSNRKVLTSATFASLTSETQGDLIVLFQDQIEGKSSLSYLTENAVSCNQTARQAVLLNFEWIDLNRKQLLQVDHPNGAHAFSIGFGHILNKKSRDLIIAFSVLDHGRTLSYYKVGFGVGQDGSPPRFWSHNILVPNLFAEDIQCSSLAIGRVRSLNSIDLIYAIIDRRNHRNVMKYTVGFNIGPDGEPLDGWTSAINIPGWFGQNTSAVGVSILDVDEDGELDLLAYHVADWRSRKLPYLRVGRSLDKKGDVKGGWTKFVQGVDSKGLEAYLFEGGMAATKTECTDVLVASISARISSKEPSIWYRVSKHLVTKELLDTSEPLSTFEYFHDGCLECYPASYAQECVSVLQACSSRVHEVHLEMTGNRAYAPVLKMHNRRSNSQHFTAPKPIINSIYCTGFHYLYTSYGGCEITDEKSVLAKGVEQSFREVLEEIDPEALQDVTSSSLHEEPSGLGGSSRRPVAAVITIEDNSFSREIAIKKAARKLRGRPGFSSFSYDIPPRRVIRMNNTWYVTFYFKRKLFMR